MLSFILGCLLVSAILIYIWLLKTADASVRAKLRAIPLAFFHLLLSRDGKWKKPADPQETLLLAMKAGQTMKRKRVYFVRHGESLWNQVFNRGFNVGIIWRFVECAIQEFHLLPVPDSVFWDSPLSPLGIRQAVQLSSWIEQSSSTNPHAAVLGGQSEVPSVLCSSNLRRAVATLLTCLSGRLLRKSKEQVHVIS